MLDRNQVTRIKAVDIIKDKWFSDYEILYQQQKQEYLDTDEETEVNLKATRNKRSPRKVEISKESTAKSMDPLEIIEESDELVMSSSDAKANLKTHLKNKSNYKQSTILTPVSVYTLKYNLFSKNIYFILFYRESKRRMRRNRKKYLFLFVYSFNNNQ